MKKVVDMKKIKVGDIVETWNEDHDFLVLTRVETVDKFNGEIFIEVEDHSKKVFFKDIFAHYIMVTK